VSNPPQERCEKAAIRFLHHYERSSPQALPKIAIFTLKPFFLLLFSAKRESTLSVIARMAEKTMLQT
jgi:hypothetical protein